MSEVVWKVCRKSEGKLFSCFAWASSRLEYKVDEWVEAPIGTKLFAFRNYGDTMDFMDQYDYGSLIVFRATAEGVSRAPLAILFNMLTDNQEVVGDFWQGMGRPEYDLRPTPPGTVLCQRLKLERVD
jgi:hypothetical protein